MRSSTVLSLLAAAVPALACDSCYGPQDAVVHTRNVPRMQPGVPGATTGPKAPLEWGQINFLHTTDTHGWLEGHLKEQNYGADWGDFVSFTKHMKQTADRKGLDLLLVDTGDLHDGNGLSDASTVDGTLSNPIFEQIDYDILTIGNHELYVSEVAYDTFSHFSKVWGEKYLTSNVQIINPKTGQFEYIGAKYRYFKTKQGLRVLAFGVLYDFTGNSNVSKVIKAADMVQEKWFTDAINTKSPVDLFLITGHNSIRTTSGSTFSFVYNAIRAVHATTPIQVFGGHTHIRDFAVYDGSTTALESGRYCETLGWLAISGIKSSSYHGNKKYHGPAPSRKAVQGTTSSTVYSRRYLDWNRKTFAYHSAGSQAYGFDDNSGLRVTSEISALRKKLKLTSLYGCSPASYCMTCVAFNTPGSIFPVVETALGATVVNASRSTIPRLIIGNTGSVRFDLYKGPFTFDDSFIVSPFTDGFQYIPNVPYALAKNVLATLNGTPLNQRDERGPVLNQRNDAFGEMPIPAVDSCIDPTLGHISGISATDLKPRGVIRRTKTLVPGYTTKDDFGTDGDDTIHSAIPFLSPPNYLQANGSFPASGTPDVVDLVFFDFIATDILTALGTLGGKFVIGDVNYYLPPTGTGKFTTQDYLPAYAKLAWQAGAPNCPT